MKKLLTFASALMMSFTLQAMEVAGVSIPQTLKLEDSSLELNGAGIRRKFFMDLYVGSLYVETKSSDAAAIINSEHPVAIQLDIISGMITSERMVDTVNEGFEVATDGKMDHLRERLNSFLAVFNEKIETGDQFVMKMVPGKGLSAYKNGKYLTTVEGNDFGQTLLSIWLGEKPADRKLKKGLLDS